MDAHDPSLRVSDAEREEVVRLLHDHMLAGRLTSDEHEERVGEAWAARLGADLEHAMRELPNPWAPAPVVPAPVFVRAGPARDSGNATTSLVLGLVGLGILAVSFGILSVLSLPLSVAAWVLGRNERRKPGAPGTAFAGQLLGVLGTTLSLLAIAVFLAVIGFF